MPTPARTARLTAAPLAVPLLLLAAAGPSFAQPPGGTPAAEFRGDGPPRLFHVDRAAERRLELARRSLDTGEVAEAVDLLLLVARGPDDAVLADGTPIRAAAAGLLGGLSGEAREVFVLRAGVEAAAALDAAGLDPAALAATARDFPATPAGTRAAARLADLLLDRGEFAEAARRFEDLAALRFPPAADRDRWTLKAAVTHLRAGDRAAADERFDAVPTATRSAFAASLGLGETDGLAALAGRPGNAVGRDPGPDAWPRAGRLPGRSIASPTVAPPAAVNTVGGPAWAVGTTRELPATEVDGPAAATAGLTRAIRAAAGESLWPAARPLLLPGVAAPGGAGAVIFTTPAGVAAADARTGRTLWRSAPLPDSDFFRVAKTEEPPILTDRNRGTITAVRNLFEERVYRDAASGSLSADGRHVYAVRNVDLPKLDPSFVAGRQRGFFVDPSRRPRVNRLAAYERDTGRLAWSVGGWRSWRPTAGGGADETSAAFFCGPPLPTPHGLAVVTETGGTLRLLVLDPADGAVRRAWPLAVPPLPTFEPPRWRVAGLQVAAAAGLWVVPTAAGGAVAVDPRTGSFAWSYRYRESVAVEGGPPVPRRAALDASEDDQPRWADAPPRIAAGRVLLAPRDSEQLHCLDLRTGAVNWVRPRGTGRQLAGVLPGEGGRPVVLVVGDDGVRAVGLDDGGDRWFTPLTSPVGDAVPAGDVLLVPMTDDTIAAVRTDGGGVASRLPAGGAAGNLVAAGGRLAAQSPVAAAAFATRAEIESGLDAALLGGAADPAVLLLRADLRLQGGAVDAALADLAAAATAPAEPGGAGVERRLAAGEARDRLAEVLAGGLRRDYAAFESRLEAARGALGEPLRGELARAVADGLANSGEPGLAFAALAEAEDGPVPDAVAAAVYARPRLPDLFSRCDAAGREDGAAVVTVTFTAAGGDAAALEAFALRFGRLTVSAEWGEGGRVDLADAALRRAADLLLADSPPRVAAAERLLAWAAGRSGTEPTGEEDGGTGAEPPAFAGRGLVAEEARDRGRAFAPVRVPVLSGPPRTAGGRLSVDQVGPGLRWQSADGAVRWVRPLTARAPDWGLRAAFSGRLVAVGLGDRVLMLDASAEPGDDSVPTAELLWETSLPDRPRLGRPAPPAGVRRILSSPGSAGRESPGPCVFSPRQVVIRSGDALAARHPLTGARLWRHAGVPRGATVSGDDRFVLILPPNAATATVLRADDGADLGTVPAPPDRDRWLERGTRVWTLTGVRDEDEEPKLRFACFDLVGSPAGDEPGPTELVWERFFPPATRLRLDDDAAAVATLTPDRRFEAVDVETGEPLAAADLPAGPVGEPAAAVWAFRSPAGWAAVVAEDSRNAGGFGRGFGPGSVWATPPETAAHGVAAGADGGPPVWSRAVAGPPSEVWHPPGLPLLALPGVATGGGGGPPSRRTFSLVLYDTRNGAELASAGYAAPLVPAEWEVPTGGPWADDRPVRLRTRGADFAVDLADGPPAPPVGPPGDTPPDPPADGS